MIRKPFLMFFVSLLSLGAAAQEVWTYSDCVGYAREHNISLQKYRLAEQSAASDLEAAKGQWQPTLDFATSQEYTNTPWAAASKNAYSSSYGLNAGWTLWDGGVRDNTIKRNELSVKQAQLVSDDYLRTIETDLLQVYLNLLYAAEAIDINASAVELSKAQAERAKALMEMGKMSRVEYAQLNSQYEQDCYNLVNARSTYDSRRMELKQLLELGLDSGLTPAPVEWTADQVMAQLPAMEETYALARGLDLQIASLELDKEAADIDVKIAGAGRSPKISVNAGAGTGYYAPGSAFGTGLKRGWNEHIGLSLSIPILDQKKTSTAVTKAKVQQLDADLDIDKREITLAQAVESWYIDTRSAQSRYQAAEQQLVSAELTDELTNERFRLGYIDPLELLTSHSALVQARHSLLQAKYMAILGQKMIEYYRTASITL